MIENLYYGHSCEQCGGHTFKNAVESSFSFDYELLKKSLKRIYEDDFNPMTEIEQNLFDATLQVFNKAIDEGYGTFVESDPEYDFYNQLRTNNEVFSAFRTHTMQNDLAKQLIDDKGILKPFKQWSNDVQTIVDHHVERWMRTEYDTAILRAHQAADWQQFEREKDILPNLRWMPTTSPAADQVHKVFWQAKLTLPVDHRFWLSHNPGDRWNCKCALESTDEDATPGSEVPASNYKPDKGLDNNVAKTGELFSKTHPFIADAPKGTDKVVDKFIKNYKSDYKEVSTIKEAEDYANKFSKKYIGDKTFKGEINYKDISIEHANEINKALTDVFTKLDLPKISGIKVISPTSSQGKKAFKSGGDTIASYNPIDKGIYINKDILKDAKSFANYIKKSEDAWNTVMDNIDKLSEAQKAIALKYKEAGRSLVGNTVKDYITHELGHHNQWSMPSKMNNLLGDNMSKYASKISGYATTSKGEYMAESFSAYMKGETNVLDPDFVSYLDSLIF